MPVLTITTNYDGHAYFNVGAGTYAKDATGLVMRVGFSSKDNIIYRSFIRFSLADLPSNAVISQVRLYVNCSSAGGTAHLTDIHAYGSAGQEDPEADDAATAYARCASGNLYVDNSIDLRTTGEKWFVLGGPIAQDIINAKNAVNRFSLGLHEEGDNDLYAELSTYDLTPGLAAKLEITYEVPVIIVKKPLMDGLVFVEG